MRARSFLIRALLAGLAAAIITALVWAHWPEKPIVTDATVTQIVVLKAQRQMILYSGDRPLKVYRVSLGRSPIGQKEIEGDKKTPEGEYFIATHNPRSSCHLSLHISYPSPEQAAAARQKGIDPGGDVMIHGLKFGFGWIGKFHRLVDWTAGCVGVTNEEMDEIYRVVPDGTKVVIKAG